MVDEFADIERGDISVAVDAKPASTAENVVTRGIAHAVLHDAAVFGAVKDLVDVVGVGLEVIGMDARLPEIAAAVYVLRRKTEIAQGTLRPKGAVLVQVLDKEITALVEHRKGVKNAIAYFEVVGVDLRDIAPIEVHGMT